MFNLSLRDEWISDGVNNKKFCHRLSDDEDEDTEDGDGSAEGAGGGGQEGDGQGTIISHSGQGSKTLDKGQKAEEEKSQESLAVHCEGLLQKVGSKKNAKKPKKVFSLPFK